MYPFSRSPLQPGWLKFFSFPFFLILKCILNFLCVYLDFSWRSWHCYYCSPVDSGSSGSYCQKENFLIPRYSGQYFMWATRIKVVKIMDSCNFFKAFSFSAVSGAHLKLEEPIYLLPFWSYMWMSSKCLLLMQVNQFFKQSSKWVHSVENVLFFLIFVISSC